MTEPFPGSPDDMMNTIAALRARVAQLETALPFRDYVERTADDILALRVRIEDMRKANEGIAAERDEAIRQSQGYLKGARELIDKNDALRARVAKLEAALKEIGREQSAKTATVAADKFQSIARAALSETVEA